MTDETRDAGVTPERIDPHEALRRMREGWTYLDVRAEDEFAAGHPEGALNVPLLRATGAHGELVPNDDFLPTLTALFPRDAPLVVGCASGRRSARAVAALAAAGFTRLADQSEGWDGTRDAFGSRVLPGWSGARLPREDGEPESRRWDALQRRAARS